MSDFGSDLYSLNINFYSSFKFSLQCLKIICKRRQDSVIENTEKQLSSSDVPLCLKIAQFLKSYPHCEDAIIVLYYMLNMMQENKMK